MTRSTRPMKLCALAGIGIVAASLAPVALAAARQTRRRPLVTVYPSPGARYAWPETAINFRGADAAGLGEVTVTGSRSGAHPTVATAHSDGRGVSLQPTEPFEPGETVSVRTRLDVRGATAGDFRLRVARPGPKLKRPRVHEPAGGPATVRSFHSRHDLHPGRVTVTSAGPGRAPGYVFVAPKLGPGHNGPLIVDDRGEPVWFQPVPPGEEADGLRVQQLGGQPVLTWWQGYDNLGTGNGVGRIFDAGYREIATVGAGDGYDGIDPHEVRLTPRGTALVTIEAPVRLDLSRLGGARDGIVFDSIVQEIDIATGAVLLEWHSLDHVPLGDSYHHPHKRARDPFDYFHVNSVEPLPGSGLLISARNTWGVYRLDQYTGAVRWTLGGRASDFRLGRGVAFAWQHDARVRRDGALTIYDDEATPGVGDQSRAIVVRVDLRSKRAWLVREYRHSPPLLSGSQGNVQDLANGNVFVGWGQIPSFSEHAPDGRQLFDAHLPKGTMTYRSYRDEWAGQPAEPPAVAASSDGRTTKVYASWNGATAVARWRVLAGDSPTSLAPVRSAARGGFETVLSLAGARRYVAVAALDGRGGVLGTSRTVAPKRTAPAR